MKVNEVRLMKMRLKIVSLQELRGSYFIYLPKQYAEENLKKGDRMVWEVEEGNHDILHLKKLELGDKHVRRA